MKITIDTERMTVGVEAPVNLNELHERLVILLPNDEWKKYSLEDRVTEIRIIEKETYWPIYPYPWTSPSWPTPIAPDTAPWNPIIYCKDTGGVYNINM